MSELLQMLTGWLGYLERPSTLIQLAILIAAALISGQLARRHPRALRPALKTPFALMLVALGCLLLRLASKASAPRAAAVRASPYAWSREYEHCVVKVNTSAMTGSFGAQ